MTRLGTRADVELQNEFVDDLRDAAGAALGTVQVPDVIARLNPEDVQPWAIFDGFIDEVAARCVNELTPKWADQLAGFDVFIWDQCYAMEQSLTHRLSRRQVPKKRPPFLKEKLLKIRVRKGRSPPMMARYRRFGLS